MLHGLPTSCKWGKKKKSPQLKFDNVINPLATYTQSYRKLTEEPTVHDFETLGTICACFKR